jgi:hypothetical protein
LKDSHYTGLEAEGYLNTGRQGNSGRQDEGYSELSLKDIQKEYSTKRKDSQRGRG